jgi:hypothetical protein
MGVAGRGLYGCGPFSAGDQPTPMPATLILRHGDAGQIERAQVHRRANPVGATTAITFISCHFRGFPISQNYPPKTAK